MRYELYSGVKRIKTKIDLSKTLMGLVALALPAVMVLSIGSALAATTVVVTPSNNQGWMFNRDANTSTPYEFTEDEQSIGDGSLYVLPIGGVNRFDKFVAEKPMGIPVSELSSISYDFMIAGNGTSADADQFYLNVYTNLPGSSTFYDCRFDFVPSTGSNTSFTTASFSTTSTPTNVGDRAADGFTCPATLAAMPAGSTISFFSLNIGDTSLNDSGLAGYLDNVVVSTASDVTTYDFELTNTPSDKNACKKGGWMSLTDQNGETFKNQGQCVSWTNGPGQ